MYSSAAEVSSVVEIVRDDGTSWFQVGGYNSYSVHPYVTVGDRPIPICRLFGATDFTAVTKFVRKFRNLDESVRIDPITLPESEFLRYPTYKDQVFRWRYTDNFIKLVEKVNGSNIITSYMRNSHVVDPESLLEYPNFYVTRPKISEKLWFEEVTKSTAIERMTIEAVYGKDYPAG